jgi:hypothetical protein
VRARLKRVVDHPRGAVGDGAVPETDDTFGDLEDAASGQAFAVAGQKRLAGRKRLAHGRVVRNKPEEVGFDRQHAAQALADAGRETTRLREIRSPLLV